jgi:general secretion pathway protein K
MVAQLRKKERGVALLAVLLGIALMTLVVMDFAMTAGLGFVSAANQANEMRAGYLARSGINVGLGLLAADARTKAQSQQGQTPVEALTDAWATPFPPIPLEGGTVTLSIVDEARKINLNSMVQNGVPQPLAIQRMQRLFTVLDVNVQLVQGIVDWITPNNSAGGGGTGDYYMGLKPPYEPRYGAMPTIADLQMVEGFNEAVFNRVSPFLTVMPEPGVNANTAAPQVLAALEPQLMEDEKLVQELVEARAVRPFTNTTDIMNLPDLGETLSQALSKDVVVRSTFFTINGTGTFAGARKIITATFHREANGIGTMAAWHEE